MTASYEYDPFGQLIRATGSFAASNPIRFSSKYFDDEVGLSYYGYRYYNASLRRWLNRDPIQEWGGLNVYGFCYDVPTGFVDNNGGNPVALVGAGTATTTTASTGAAGGVTVTVNLGAGGGSASSGAIATGLGATIATGAGIALASGAAAYLINKDANLYADTSQLNADSRALEMMAAQQEKKLADHQEAQRGKAQHLNDGDWEDQFGNVYDKDGKWLRDKLGNSVECKKKQKPKGGVYVLRDPDTGDVVRTGRTNDLDRREGEHGRDPELGKYVFDPVYNTDDYAEQRGLEQNLHDQYNPPLNRIRPISPDNPNRQKYLDAARHFLDQL